MNSHEVFIHIHQGCFAGTGAIVRLPQCQWSKPDGYGKISQCITVCIFLGIYCNSILYFILSVITCSMMGLKLNHVHYNIMEQDVQGTTMMTSSNRNIFRVTGHLCGEFPGPGEFPAQRPVTRSFDVFFDLRLNKWLSKQSWGWWFETLSRPLWRHCNEHPRPAGITKCEH